MRIMMLGSGTGSMRNLFKSALAIGLWLFAMGRAFGQEFQGVGTVVDVNPEGIVILDHEEIKGFMPPMQMPFPVAQPDLLKDLKPGDRVRFTVVAVGRMRGMITQIAKAEAKREKVAIMAPDFALPDLSGRTIHLSEFKGKPILLNFWATWCPPCRTEMPSLERAYQDYKGKGLVVLTINIDQRSPSRVEAFVKEYSLTFPILLDPEWTAAEAYRVFGRVPTTYLINRAGEIVAEAGGLDWTGPVARNALEALLR